ncbi:MAG: hypothetical protein IK099_02470 [Clostridia bacterium]|nr:hypothetical protein [Clostridia bacterium]
MKKWMMALLFLLLPFSFAAAEGINPFLEVPVQMTANAETPDQFVSFSGMDFGEGASLIRFKAATEDALTIRVYADNMEGKPIATAVFHALTKEYRYTVDLTGVHDLYFKLEGNGLFVSWQAFTSKADIEEAIRSERSEAYEDTLPFDYTRACANGGTVEKFTYEAHDVFNGGAVYEKTAFVYLPFGYDAAQTYDLLILCHGIGGNEYEWGLTGKDSRVKRVMDNLIDKGEIKPFIVVTPNGRAGKTEDHSSFYRFDEELRNDLLPALAVRYAVDIHDRNRCAMAGLSMGGMQTINLGIGKCLDIFSAFGAFSACPTTNTASVTAGVLNGSGELPIRVFYSICGTEDNIALASAKAAVEGLDALTDRLNEKNFIQQYVPGGHDFGVWYLGFYNFARMIGGPQE